MSIKMNNEWLSSIDEEVSNFKSTELPAFRDFGLYSDFSDFCCNLSDESNMITNLFPSKLTKHLQYSMDDEEEHHEEEHHEEEHHGEELKQNSSYEQFFHEINMNQQSILPCDILPSHFLLKTPGPRLIINNISSLNEFQMILQNYLNTKMDLWNISYLNSYQLQLKCKKTNFEISIVIGWNEIHNHGWLQLQKQFSGYLMEYNLLLDDLRHLTSSYSSASSTSTSSMITTNDSMEIESSTSVLSPRSMKVLPYDSISFLSLDDFEMIMNGLHERLADSSSYDEVSCHVNELQNNSSISPSFFERPSFLSLTAQLII